MQYKFEGGIDFFAELTKESTVEDTPDDVCNITGEELGEHHVTLLCGHKFNYEPLYNEVKSQKYSIPCRVRLSVKQIKCPLCRKIQSQLLPWVPSIINCPKMHGVNSPFIYTMCPNKCDYVFKCGKYKGKTCNKSCVGEKCNLHMKYSVVNNVVIQNEPGLQNEALNLCPAIIKSGPNKGKICKCPIKQNGFCNRHNK
tara:strand:+ start:9453 stop:10046 length:594 start_codon:yes stop_codon:yes gene_type:complete